jgi:hypothetical protein
VFAAVRAVDDRGAVSEPAVRAFFADHVAPTVRIVSPQPSVFFPVLVLPYLRITWQGNDPDGADPSRLAKYRFVLIPEGTPDFQIGLVDPDSLRRRYAPGFAGWDSVPGDTLETTYRDLVPNRQYLFVLVGIDEQGDYSAVFSRNTNMLLVRVTYEGATGPRFTVRSDIFE